MENVPSWTNMSHRITMREAGIPVLVMHRVEVDEYITLVDRYTMMSGGL